MHEPNRLYYIFHLKLESDKKGQKFNKQLNLESCLIAGVDEGETTTLSTFTFSFPLQCNRTWRRRARGPMNSQTSVEWPSVRSPSTEVTIQFPEIRFTYLLYI